MGENIAVDHLMGSFWCAGVRYSGYLDISKDQRCIGQQHSHKYMLDYTLQFTELYSGLNQWVLVDILTAHEDSGTVVRTLDEDLKDFLQEFLNRPQEFVLYIEADHGMRYGDWYRLIEGSLEHKLPLLLILASTEFLQRNEWSLDNFDYNSNRLVSKFDLRMTDLHLSRLPYSQKYPEEFPE